jgi:hypothetical protein
VFDRLLLTMYILIFVQSIVQISALCFVLGCCTRYYTGCHTYGVVQVIADGVVRIIPQDVIQIDHGRGCCKCCC